VNFVSHKPTHRPIPIAVGIKRACKANADKIVFNPVSFRDQHFKKIKTLQHIARQKQQAMTQKLNIDKAYNNKKKEDQQVTFRTIKTHPPHQVHSKREEIKISLVGQDL